MTYDCASAMEAQRAFCDAQELPHFAPFDGVCYHCGRNIYSPEKRRNGLVCGVSVEDASSRLITGCPHCAMSFCE